MEGIRQGRVDKGGLKGEGRKGRINYEEQTGLERQGRTGSDR